MENSTVFQHQHANHLIDGYGKTLHCIFEKFSVTVTRSLSNYAGYRSLLYNRVAHMSIGEVLSGWISKDWVVGGEGISCQSRLVSQESERRFVVGNTDAELHRCKMNRREAHSHALTSVRCGESWQ